MDLNSGLTTQTTYAAYWLLPMAVLLDADPVLGLSGYMLFSLGRSIPIVVGPLLPHDGLSWAMRLREPLRPWVNTIAAVIALFGVLHGLAQ